MFASLRFRHLTMFLLSWLFSTWGASMYAQGHPELKAEDFTLEKIYGSSTCNTPSTLRITYANRVVGFTKLTYKLTYTNAAGTKVPMEVSTSNVGQPCSIVFPDDQVNYSQIDVEAEYGGATPETTKIYDYENFRVESIVDHIGYNNFLPKQLGAGEGCNNVFKMQLPISGVKEYSYKIYNSSNTLVLSAEHLDPYKEHRFSLADIGQYTFEMTIVPDCPNPNKGANGYYASWDNNNVVTKPREFYAQGPDNWQLGIFPETYLDNCVLKGEARLTPTDPYRYFYGGLNKRELGVSSITYEIRKKGETTLFKSIKSTDAPYFEAMVRDLDPNQQYTVKAISDCGIQSEESNLGFQSTSLNISSQSSGFSNCVGFLKQYISVYGLKKGDFSSLTYTLRKKDDPTTFKTETVVPVYNQNGWMESIEVDVTNLPVGEYELTAVTDCGFELKKGLLY